MNSPRALNGRGVEQKSSYVSFKPGFRDMRESQAWTIIDNEKCINIGEEQGFPLESRHTLCLVISAPSGIRVRGDK